MATISAHARVSVMASRKKTETSKKKIRDRISERLSYRLRLFLPLAAILWLLLGSFALLQNARTRQLRLEAVGDQVNFISERIVALYEHNENVTSYLKFLEDYYVGSIYDDLSIAVYDNVSGNILQDVGFNAPRPKNINVDGDIITGDYLNRDIDSDANLDPGKKFFYSETLPPDGSLVVQVILPLSEEVSERVSLHWVWWLLLLCGATAGTIVIWVITSHLARNVASLEKFAEDAATGNEITPDIRFSRDDLGRIGSKILAIYSQRAEAQAAREREHTIAVKATEERANLKRQMTNNISHELKTPVGVIRGYVDTMVENPEMDEASRTHFLTKTQSHVERLCNLLNDLSTMTRLDEASANIPTEPLSFNEILENIAHDIADSGLAGEMKFKTAIPDNCIVQANGALLTGALMNLVKNAVNYSHGTEMGVRLMVQNRRFYTFVFYDNGSGVAPEHIPHLFERFYRIDKGRSRKAGGTGLGLPIVKSTINSLGGSITVRNAATGGLEFVFTLPKAV